MGDELRRAGLETGFPLWRPGIFIFAHDLVFPTPSKGHHVGVSSIIKRVSIHAAASPPTYPILPNPARGCAPVPVLPSVAVQGAVMAKTLDRMRTCLSGISGRCNIHSVLSM